ncbi:reticulon-like protein B17 isoform X1 [Tripterygium wilfordii]|uniref:Reticulon-like protein n=1 Tax=Tripterygium wilfordii TaxID=458696 RepID=A0A7J7CEH2_TRIWF|nr:reticulon-like protein B18 [Tripterygium wilfordii]KAF5732574.1 reticulon-like protein B17 isoform X1 [Tripterygium wilfordii]
MDSTPHSLRSSPHLNTKSASRLARIAFSDQSKQPSNLLLDLVPLSPTNTPFPSPISLRSSNGLPLQELLLLSPSPLRKSRTRLTDRIEMVEDGVEPTSATRRRCKNRGAQMALMGCASPRNTRRSRRRSEIEMKEERDPALVEEIGKARKRRNSGRSKKEKLSLVPLVPSPSPSPKNDDGDSGNFDGIGMVVANLIMWKDVAISSLWFGLGCLCFLSSCFAQGINFSIFSAISQLGLLFLGASFFSNSICQRNNVEKKREFKLKEEDILRLGRLILPAANLAISKTRQLFSGDPSMTLKVIPFLLLGAEYGHLITLRRLCTLGFFISFTVPRLYCCYSSQIKQKVENMKRRVIETWLACSHKKIVVASAATAFWKLSSIKTRIFTAFISLVILQYCRKHLVAKSEEEEAEEGERENLHQALVLAEGQEQHALVVAEAAASPK